jgi:hypothetical protein
MSERSQGTGDELVLRGEPLDPVAHIRQNSGSADALELPRQVRQFGGAQALAGGLERMGRPAKGVAIRRGQAPA